MAVGKPAANRLAGAAKALADPPFGKSSFHAQQGFIAPHPFSSDLQDFIRAVALR
jgi:hypothetical protein